MNLKKNQKRIQPIRIQLWIKMTKIDLTYLTAKR